MKELHFASAAAVHALLLLLLLVSLTSSSGQDLLQVDDDGDDYDDFYLLVKTMEESRNGLEERRLRLLHHYAYNRTLRGPIDEPPFVATDNPRLDSRGDVNDLVHWTASRIILRLDITDAENIILDPTSKPFAVAGTSIAPEDPSSPCHRNGDYDFVTINWLYLLYTAREHPDSFSREAYNKIVLELLTEYGDSKSFTFDLVCPNDEVPLLRLDLKDTENHVMMRAVSRYLTNQLRAEFPEHENDWRVDNQRNGYHEWMLRYLASFITNHFEEYNSRAYQGYTVRPLSVLHSLASHPDIVKAAGMVLDLISGFSAIQSNQLRRWPPFRRVPQYVYYEGYDEDPAAAAHLSWSYDTEASRLAILAGNYYDFPGSSLYDPKTPHRARHSMTAVLTSYRMDDVLLDLAVRQHQRSGGDEDDARFFVGRHHNVEMYASSAHAHISAGGVFRAEVPPATEFLPPLVNDIIKTLVDDQNGWSQPTVIIPSREQSPDLRDMMRFGGREVLPASAVLLQDEMEEIVMEGDSPRDMLQQRENTCVAPGFACGLSPSMGRRIEALEDTSCVDDVNNDEEDWRFYDLSRAECLDYGFYVAVYERACDTARCRQGSVTGTYGLLEIGEASSERMFDEFKSAVLANNPGPFSSNEVHTYITTRGHTIQFEIDPAIGQSSLVQLDGFRFDRDFNKWVRGWGDTIQSTTPGRVTLDSSRGIRKRLILDVVDPLKPRRLSVDLPVLDRMAAVGVDGGVFFDDGGAVISGEGVKWLRLRTGIVGELLGFDMGWRSGLEASHGGQGWTASKLELQPKEHFTQVEVCVSSSGTTIARIRIVTSLDRRFSGGLCLPFLTSCETFSAGQDKQVIAFYGRADSVIRQLGVISTSL